MATEEETLNIDDTMGQIFDNLEKEDADLELETEETEGDTSEAEGSQEEDVSDDDPGESEEEAEEGDDEKDDAEDEGEEGESEEAEEPESLEPNEKLPPESWTPENRQRFDKLPDWAKKEIHRREKDMEAGVEKLKEQNSFGHQIDKTIQPYKPYLNQKGLQPEAVIENALNFAYSLENSSPQQRGQMLKNIAKQYGADLSVFSQDDEQSNKIDQSLNPVMQELSQLKQELYGQKQASEQQQIQEAQAEIQKFQTATDENGNLKYPYFDRVRDVMSSFIESGRATTLEDAYDQAVWANPDTRRLLQSEQQKQEQASREAKARKKAEKARNANKLDVGKKGEHSSTGGKPPGTIDDTLNETFERLANS